MNRRKFIWSGVAAGSALGVAGQLLAGENADADVYPPKESRLPSPGNTSYYIDSVNGDDSSSGLSADRAWRTFIPVNRLLLAPGDQVRISAPGSFDHSLMLMGAGTESAPVRVVFAPGRYQFYPGNAIGRKYQISNTNSDPDGLKAIGILLDGARHFKITGTDALIFYRGKMIEVCIDGCEDIEISGLHFDYHRPTVSEFQVVEVGDDHADLRINPDSHYKIEDGRIEWIGEGWKMRDGLWQDLDPERNTVRRIGGGHLKGLELEELEPFLVRARGRISPRIKAGHIYQIRDTHRDCAGVFTRRSKNIKWDNVAFHFMHGMGVVNQFSENIAFNRLAVIPRKESGRTTAAWADCLQISGCRGKILVSDCIFSGAHDDAINIHGTHLRVVERLAQNRVRVRFMHSQTFGFMAFNAGDEVLFVHTDSLQTYGPNNVKNAELINPKEMLITLANPLPGEFEINDAIENVTWTPEVEIRKCTVSRIPTRGFLITTRRKVLVEENEFNKTNMSAILIENDAKKWYESGPVRDMTIRGNRFIECGQPVIKINPQNRSANDSVHRNIRIENNSFLLHGQIKAKSTKGLTVVGNRFYSDQTLDEQSIVETSDCADVKIEDNRFLPTREWIPKPETSAFR